MKENPYIDGMRGEHWCLLWQDSSAEFANHLHAMPDSDVLKLLEWIVANDKTHTRMYTMVRSTTLGRMGERAHA